MGYITLEPELDFTVIGFITPKYPDMKVDVWVDGVPVVENEEPAYDEALYLAYIKLPGEKYKHGSYIVGRLKSRYIAVFHNNILSINIKQPIEQWVEPEPYGRAIVRRVRC